MILKMPLEKCIVIKESVLEKDMILKNDIFRVCTGCVDQYIVTEDNRLCGVISSFDIEEKINGNSDADIKTVINRNPVTVVHSERFERELVEHIFSKTSRIRSVPIVNRKGEIQYIYIKVNGSLQKFVEQNFPDDGSCYQNAIKQEILLLEKWYPDVKINVLSDFDKYGMDLGEIKERCINEEEIDSLKPDKDFVLLVYLYDFNCTCKGGAIERLIGKKIRFCGSNYTKRDVVEEVVPYFKVDETAKDVLEEEVCHNGNYFDLNDFQNIFQAIHMTRGLNGSYVEIGTYRGDSARAALSYMEKSGISRKAFFLDTYEGFTYAEAEASSDCTWANSHDDTSMEIVESRLQEFSNYKLIKTNIITDGLPEEIGDIAVCNIDVDMYEAVSAALEKVCDRIIKGGVIIAEDFGHTPALFGAQYAVLKFMDLHGKDFYGIYLQSGQYLMIRKPN